ncbi:MAG TPA: peptidoglycan DD-metalloendopeptidase family protein [Acidobacteriota bacterium]|jgi:murein DD-endopeptidase MepM/ murein hydrolase activator NlpD
MKPRIFWTSCAFVCLVAVGYWIHWQTRPALQAAPVSSLSGPATKTGIAVPTLVQGSLEEHTTLSDLLSRLGMNSAEVQALIADVRPSYDLGRVRAGNRYAAERGSSGELIFFRYEIDHDRYLTVHRQQDRFTASVENYQYEIRQEELGGSIEGSLFATLTNLGESEELADALYNIFRWDIDFNSDIRPGDTFRLIFEKKMLDGKFSGYGRILSAEFVNQNKVHQAFYFERKNAIREDRLLGRMSRLPKPRKVREADRGEYFDPFGRPLRKAFLRSPLAMVYRVTSRFTRARFHPILKRYRPHLGVDFGAPEGTLVLASGSGVVRFAGYRAGFGKYIEVDHGNRYVTSYGHLSALLVRAGTYVSQGARIGRVGSTGLSTGPHLDYRIRFGKKFVNPLDPVRFPTTAPLEKRHMPEFLAVVRRFQPRLRGIQLATVLNSERRADS